MAKLPQFMNEQDEAAFWDTHDSAEFLDETEAVAIKFVDARPAKKQISLRLDPDVGDGTGSEDSNSLTQITGRTDL